MTRNVFGGMLNLTQPTKPLCGTVQICYTCYTCCINVQRCDMDLIANQCNRLQGHKIVFVRQKNPSQKTSESFNFECMTLKVVSKRLTVASMQVTK